MSEWNRNISMRALRAFCAAAQRLSFRQAAEDLYLTASAISHQVKQLETEVGTPLFQRLPRGLGLTTAGRRFASELQPILEQLDEVVGQHCGNNEPSEVSLAVRPLFADELLMPSLGKFLEAHPDFRIRVETSEDLYSDDVTCDVAIRMFRTQPTSGHWERLFPVTHVPIGTLDLYRRISVLGTRVREPFPIIVHDRRPNAWRDWQSASGIRLPKDCPVIKLNSSLSVARAATQGLGAALLPADLCASSIQSGVVVPLFDQELESGEAFYFGAYNTLRKDAAFVAFKTWVLQQFARQT